MRNIVVSGGTRGLGLAIAHRLAGAGYHVIAIGRTRTDAIAQAEQAEPGSGGGKIVFRAYDLTEVAGMADFVKGLSQEFGPVHGLVNNAALGTSGVLANMRDSQIERLLHLNVTSPITLTKYAVRSMMVGGGGRIVNISSIIATTGYTGLSVYAASKAAMVGFTRSLARELGPLGITVNAIAPGFLDTEMTGGMLPADVARVTRRSALRRLAGLDDVAAAAAYLFSEDARNITGTILTVDAGSTA